LLSKPNTGELGGGRMLEGPLLSGEGKLDVWWGSWNGIPIKSPLPKLDEPRVVDPLVIGLMGLLMTGVVILL